VKPQWRRRPGVPSLSIRTVYRPGVILKAWNPVVVLPNADEVPCLSTTALVLTAPRSFDGQCFLSMSEDRTVGIYAAERSACSSRETHMSPNNDTAFLRQKRGSTAT